MALARAVIDAGIGISHCAVVSQAVHVYSVNIDQWPGLHAVIYNR